MEKLASEEKGGGGDVLAFAPDGKTLAWGNQNGVTLLNPAEKDSKKRRLLKASGWVPSLSFSPDGLLLACGMQGGHIRLVDATKAEPQEGTALRGDECAWIYVVFAPDGKTLLSSGWDGKLILWNPATGQKRREWQLPGMIREACFAPDGRHVITSNGNGTVYILRLAPPGEAVK
jgi:WD40 repeat protein